MKANELRIGNLVNSKELDLSNGKELEKVIAVDMYVIHEMINGNRCNKYSPIPITEEILLKAGFDKINHRIDGIICRKGWLRFNSNIMATDWRGGSINGDLYQYVHQLQNLYFALTGEELIIEL